MRAFQSTWAKTFDVTPVSGLTLRAVMEAQNLAIAHQTMLATWALFAAAIGSLAVAFWQLNRFVASQVIGNTLSYIDKFTEIVHEVSDDDSVSIHTALSTVGAYFTGPAAIRQYKQAANAYRRGTSGHPMVLTPEQIQFYLRLTNSLVISLTYFREAANLVSRGILDFGLIWAHFENVPTPDSPLRSAARHRAVRNARSRR